MKTFKVVIEEFDSQEYFILHNTHLLIGYIYYNASATHLDLAPQIRRAQFLSLLRRRKPYHILNFFLARKNSRMEPDLVKKKAVRVIRTLSHKFFAGKMRFVYRALSRKTNIFLYNFMHLPFRIFAHSVE